MNVNVARYLSAIAVVAVLCSCTKSGQVGATGSAAPKTHYLRIADGTGDIPTLNPHLFTEVTLGYIAEMTQAYLVKYDAQNNPYPELVTEVPTLANGGISKDGTTITWHIRKGVKWSDGEPFDADDVVFSTNAVNNPANNEVGRDGWNLITKIDEPDKYTVVYHLKHAYASYEPTFFGTAGANPSVIPKHILGSLPNINNAPYNSKPVGIGPFRIVAWKRGDSVELEANPYYFRGVPKINRITYKLIPSRDTLVTLLQTGDVDLWPEVPARYITRVKELQTFQSDVALTPWYSHIDFNVTRPIVSDIRIRQAIRLAIDRQTLVNKVVQGYGLVQESTVSPVLPIAPTSTDIPLVAPDADKAKQLLDDAGWKVGSDGIRVKNGQRLSLTLPYYTGSSAADDTVEFIRAALKDVGIEIQTRQYSPANYFASYQQNGIVYGGKWDMTFFAWQTDPVGEISNIWECNQIPPNGQNVTRFCNKQLDDLLEKFKVTYDTAEHKQILLQEEKIIADNVPTIVLYIWKASNTYKKGLTDWHPGAWTLFDDMGNVDI
jgi:peptide/nickel transport system substrate-binding protein